MQNKIIKNLVSFDCDKNVHLLLEISGGIDSMVMLHFFQENKFSFKFSVAHINHCYNADNQKMENLVRDECNNKNNLIIRHIESESIKSNMESNFRNLR